MGFGAYKVIRSDFKKETATYLFKASIALNL